jgi:hypothetical protein
VDSNPESSTEAASAQKSKIQFIVSHTVKSCQLTDRSIFAFAAKIQAAFTP